MIAARKRVVARCRLRGLSIRQIVAELIGSCVANPKAADGRWSHQTIAKDLSELHEEWRCDAAFDIAEHKARLLAELRTAAAQGWENNDLSTVLTSIRQQRELLGTDAIRLTVNSEIKQYADEFDRKIAAIVERAEKERGPKKPH